MISLPVITATTVNASGADTAVGGLVLVLGFLVALVAYFLPTIVALYRGCTKAGAIVFINLIAGWTILAWIGAMIWALAGETEEAS